MVMVLACRKICRSCGNAQGEYLSRLLSVFFIASLLNLGMAAKAQAQCSEEQKARMIQNNISQKTIDKVCNPQTAGDSSTPPVDTLIKVPPEKESDSLPRDEMPERSISQNQTERRHGIGLGVSLSFPFLGTALFYDLGMKDNAIIQFQYNNDAVTTTSASGSVQFKHERRSLSGSYRTPFFQNSGFYYGVGGGIGQNSMQYQNSDLGFDQTVQGGGVMLFAEIGWQTGDRFYFRLDGRMAGYLSYADDYETEQIPDVSNHRSIADEGWEASKNPSQFIAGLGFFF